jgi:hypothetical protein
MNLSIVGVISSGNAQLSKSATQGNQVAYPKASVPTNPAGAIPLQGRLRPEGSWY